MLQVSSTTTKVPQSGRHRVSFSADENDSQSAPNKELTCEMIQDMWYSSSELGGFKQEIKSILLQQCRRGVASKASSDEFLGLERYEPKRDEFRRQAIYFTLQAQEKSKDSNFIRMVARKCTAYSRAVATKQGLVDYSVAYDSLYSLDTQGKRRQHHGEECEGPRRKKQRTVAVAY